MLPVGKLLYVRVLSKKEFILFYKKKKKNLYIYIHIHTAMAHKLRGSLLCIFLLSSFFFRFFHLIHLLFLLIFFLFWTPKPKIRERSDAKVYCSEVCMCQYFHKEETLFYRSALRWYSDTGLSLTLSVYVCMYVCMYVCVCVCVCVCVSVYVCAFQSISS